MSRNRSAHILLAAGVALWCAALLTDFHFDFWRVQELGLVFNDMASRLVHLDLTISPTAIGYEAFVHDGVTYTYFGIFPALLRMPALAVGMLDGVQYGVWSCLCAVALLQALLWRTIGEVEGRMPTSSVSPLLSVCVRVALLLSGPAIYLLNRGSLYIEPILWASVLAAGFNLAALRVVCHTGRPCAGQLAFLALMAGLALHARASIGVSLGVATGLLVVRELLAPGQGRIRRVLAAAVILGAFGLLAAAINQGRWGNPFRFADYRAYGLLQRAPGGRELMERSGELNLSRTWFALIYYETGLGYFLQRVPGLAGWIAARWFTIEPPPAADPLLIPLQYLLAGFGVRALWRRVVLAPPQRLSALLVLVGHAVPILVLLCYYAVTFRYRADFAPFILFAAFLGYPGLSARLQASEAGIWNRLVLTCTLIGVLVSHGSLVLAKIADPESPVEIRRFWLQLTPLPPSVLRLY